MRRITWTLASFGCLGMMVGCNSGTSETREYGATDQQAAATATDEDGHHAHAAPHGGQLIELGDHQYNAEVVFDKTARTLTLYVLDAHAENAVPIEATDLVFDLEKGDDEVEIPLKAQPATGEADGKSSVFVAAGDAIPAEVTDLDHAHAHIHITINGEEFTGELEHHDEHGEEGHAHEEGEHHEDGEKHEHEEKE